MADDEPIQPQQTETVERCPSCNAPQQPPGYSVHYGGCHLYPCDPERREGGWMCRFCEAPQQPWMSMHFEGCPHYRRAGAGAREPIGYTIRKPDGSALGLWPRKEEAAGAAFRLGAGYQAIAVHAGETVDGRGS